MPRFVSLGCLAVLALLFAPATRSRQVGAQQQQPDTAVTSRVLEVFARTHVAVSSLRDRYQAEFAEPRNKKPEAQAELRTRMQVDLKGILQANGLSDDEFARLTRRVASDSATRQAFELAVRQIESKK